MALTSELRLETLTLDAVAPGDENPHPQFAFTPINTVRAEKVDPRIPADERQWIGYGFVDGCRPYLLQDGYTRERQPRPFRTAVLENEILKAVFLLEYGGRLWSLVHKPSNRELLFRNPVFQLGNLAIRNAWFSGGVEWNFCWPGHTPHTCSPLFAARVQLADGTPVLRLYEYERVRQMPFQIDCFLPAGSPVLLVRVALRNPRDRAVPVYWWSNIAVPEAQGHRVLAPATELFRFDYHKSTLDLLPFPVMGGVDRSYPANHPDSNDSFFVIPRGRQPWIAALDPAGRGLFQTSTARLAGRKLFVWGQNRGSRYWQERLNTTGYNYAEIQAGLARTQSMCIPLPARTSFEWVEAYGFLEADPAAVHGTDWTRACAAVEARVAAQAPQARLEDCLTATVAMSQAEPVALIQTASGWGALEALRRAREGEMPLAGPALPFPADTLGRAQADWHMLLEQGTFPEPDPAVAPTAYMIQADWQDLLERSIAAGRSDHWYAWLQLGVIHLGARRLAEARVAWETSLARRESCWAHRNLGCLAALEQRPHDAVRHFRRAREMAPDDARLFVEYAEALLAAGLADEVFRQIEALPASRRSIPRLRMIEARAAMASDRLDAVPPLLFQPFELPDIREGDTTPSDLWFEYHARNLARQAGAGVNDEFRAEAQRRYPPPAHLDFRMVGG